MSWNKSRLVSCFAGCTLCASLLVGLGGCAAGVTGGDQAGTARSLISAQIDGPTLSINTQAVAGGSSTPAGDFTVLGRNVRYDSDAGALIVDLSVLNTTTETFAEPVSLTFVSLLPDGVTVLNPDNDQAGAGAVIRFEFANDDNQWTPNEESLPRETHFAAAEGVSIAFVARVETGDQPESGVIAGVVWEDLNGDGALGTNEPGLAGVTVSLRGRGVDAMSVQTDATGNYRFEGLPAGNYVVTKVPPDGFVPTTPTDQTVGLVDVGGEVSSALAVNFGCQREDATTAGVIAGTVFNDIDEDGTRDDNEPGLSDFVIVLTGADIDTRRTSTDATGAFRFTGLGIGTYTVEKRPRDGFTATTPEQIVVVLTGTGDQVGGFLAADFGCVAVRETNCHNGRDDDGDGLVDCDDPDCQDDPACDNTVCLCHRPPGNPSNEHTICVGASAVDAHLAHGDSVGPCAGDSGGNDNTGD